MLCVKLTHLFYVHPSINYVIILCQIRLFKISFRKIEYIHIYDKEECRRSKLKFHPLCIKYMQATVCLLSMARHLHWTFTVFVRMYNIVLTDGLSINLQQEMSYYQINYQRDELLLLLTRLNMKRCTACDRHTQFLDLRNPFSIVCLYKVAKSICKRRLLGPHYK